MISLKDSADGPFDGSGGINMEKKIRMTCEGEDAHTAYVALPGHRSEHGIVSKTIILNEVLDFKGPHVHLDLDKEGRLIGIEILA